MVEERYHRQGLLEGWNQDRLKNARIAVIGANPASHFFCAGASVIGVGNIEIYDSGELKQDKKEFLHFLSVKDKSRAKNLAKILSTINPDINANGISLELRSDADSIVLGKPDIIVDLSNNPGSKLIALEYAKKNKIPVVLGSGSYTSFKLSTYFPDKAVNKKQLFAEFKEHTQGAEVGCALGGLALREATGLVMPRENEEKLEDILYYNLDFDDRILYFPLEERQDLDLMQYNLERRESFLEGEEHPIVTSQDVFESFLNSYKKPGGDTSIEGRVYKNIALLGAGALGNFNAILYAIKDVQKITIFDFDIVEESNLNRQLLFCFGQTIGEPKAKVVAEAIRKINPNIEVEYRLETIDLGFEKYLQKNNVDLMVLCFDNFKARSLCNHFSNKYGVPLINGGVSTDQKGSASIYIPGTNACLEHQLRVDNSALQEYTPETCRYAPTPSVVTNNMIVSGFMALEANPVLEGRIFRNPLSKVLKYISNDSGRIGAMPVVKQCECYGNEKVQKEWISKTKKLFSLEIGMRQ